MNGHSDGNNGMDVSMFIVSIINILIPSVQSNDPNGRNIINLCNHMTEKNLGSSIKRLAKFISDNNEYECLNVSYESYISSVSVILNT